MILPWRYQHLDQFPHQLQRFDCAVNVIVAVFLSRNILEDVRLERTFVAVYVK